MFTVEIRIKGQLILARSANRIAGATHKTCLYVSDDGQVIEHHYDHGAAVLAIRLLSSVKNTLAAAHTLRVKRWESAQRRAQNEVLDGQPVLSRVRGTKVRTSQRQTRS